VSYFVVACSWGLWLLGVYNFHQQKMIVSEIIYIWVLKTIFEHYCDDDVMMKNGVDD